MLEERGTELNEEGDIRMEDIREEHWSDFSEYGEDNSKIHSLRWDVYTIEKEELTNR